MPNDPVTAGIVVTSLTAVAAFLAKLILDYIGYLKTQVAEANQRTRDVLSSGAAMASALDRLTDELRSRTSGRRA